MPVAAVVDQKRDHGPHPFDVRPIDDRAALARTAQQASTHQDGEVRRTDLTPREFAQEHRERLGEYVSDAQWLVDTYYSLRFGMRKVDANLRHQIAGVLGRVRAGLEKAASEAS